MIDSGSAGYFKYNADDETLSAERRANAQDAYDHVTGAYEYTGNDKETGEKVMKSGKFGEAGSATSLENVKAAIAAIKKANSYRMNDENAKDLALIPDKGVEEFRIDDLNMAISELQANYYADDLAATGSAYHNYLFYGSENLAYNTEKAWGIDAVDAYYKEKSNYELYKSNPEYFDSKENTDKLYNGGETGHYENIIGSSSVVGYGASTANGNDLSTMYFYGSGYFDNATTFSIEEYESRFNTYYDKVMSVFNSAKEAYDKAVEKLKSLQTDKAEKEAVRDTAQQEKDAADAKVEEAKQNLADAKEELQSAKDAQADADKTAAEKKELLSKANEAVSDASSALTEANKEAEKKAAAVETAEKDLQDAKDEAAEKAQTVLSSYETMQNATTSLESLNQAVVDARNELNQKTSDYNSAKAVADEKSQIASKKKNALTNAQTKLTAANADVAVAQKALEDAAADLQEKAQAVVDAKTSLEDAKKDLETKKEAVTNAEANADAKQADLDKLYSDLADAKSVMDEKSEELKSASDALASAQKAYDDAAAVLAEKQASLTTAQTDLEKKQTELGTADAAAIAAKENAEAAKKEEAKQHGILKAIEDAKDAFRAAAEKIQELTDKLASLGENKDDIEKKLADAKDALAAAVEKNERAQALNYDDMFENPVTDADFEYLNEYIDNVKALREKVAAEQAERDRIEKENTEKQNRQEATAGVWENIQQALQSIGTKYGIQISECITEDVTRISEDNAEEILEKAISGAQYGQWLSLTLGDRTEINSDLVEMIQKKSNDIYIVFDYMGYRWTVKLPKRDVLAQFMQEDHSLNLLKFISESGKQYIVKMEELSSIK